MYDSIRSPRCGHCPHPRFSHGRDGTKQAPKGWQYFTAYALTHHAEVASGYEPAVAAEMAGAKTEGKDTWGGTRCGTMWPRQPPAPRCP